MFAGPLGGATDYTYNNMGRLVSELTVPGGTESFEYNELNIRNKTTNASGRVMRMSYDANGRISGFTYRKGPVSYICDVNENVLEDSAEKCYTYDIIGRVMSKTVGNSSDNSVLL